MELFQPQPDFNLLPCDGLVNYHGPILSEQNSTKFYHTLFQSIPWAHDEVVLFGKRIVMARKVAWYGDADYSYTYSGSTKHAQIWTPELAQIKALAEKQTGSFYNSCLLNLYHDGSEGMGWHSDDEKCLGKENVIASISFGAERKFYFKHKNTNKLISITLENGSLLVMKGATQANWLHSIPKSKKIKTPRINLTFRTIVLP
ncbi:MAG: alpha-ketoglutarate-dependent dioxygenase AlkB [Blastochloris sp.]|jgi:alkylated DNA repair dioxygenase AlkB|nr:alpha-ketoglutarate-dependent dioxygenase AlkB [Blastochloris sp.]